MTRTMVVKVTLVGGFLHKESYRSLSDGLVKFVRQLDTGIMWNIEKDWERVDGAPTPTWLVPLSGNRD